MNLLSRYNIYGYTTPVPYNDGVVYDIVDRNI